MLIRRFKIQAAAMKVNGGDEVESFFSGGLPLLCIFTLHKERLTNGWFWSSSHHYSGFIVLYFVLVLDYRARCHR